jgi:WD40 repeat protein
MGTGAERPSKPPCDTPPAGPGCLGSAAAEGEEITGSRYSPDGTLVAISTELGSVAVRDAATAVEVARVPSTKAVVDALAFSSDGRLLALGDRSGLTRLVDPRTGQVRAELAGGTAVIFTVVFTPDGHLLTGDGEGVVRLWDVARRTSRTMLRTDNIYDLAVDAEGGTAAVGVDSAVVLVDLVGDRSPRTVAGHSGFVPGVAFTPDGTMVVTGGQDGTVRLWEVAGGQRVATFDHPGGGVTDVAVDRTGRRIAAMAAGGDGAIFECQVCGPPDELAALAAQHSTRELTAEERTLFGLPPSA